MCATDGFISDSSSDDDACHHIMWNPLLDPVGNRWQLQLVLSVSDVGRLACRGIDCVTNYIHFDLWCRQPQRPVAPLLGFSIGTMPTKWTQQWQSMWVPDPQHPKVTVIVFREKLVSTVDVLTWTHLPHWRVRHPRSPAVRTQFLAKRRQCRPR